MVRIARHMRSCHYAITHMRNEHCSNSKEITYCRKSVFHTERGKELAKSESKLRDVLSLKMDEILRVTVSLPLRLLLCWHSYCDVSVTLCNISVTLSKQILNEHPRSDYTELTEAVPIVTINVS